MKKEIINNLSEWAIIFYLEKNPGATRKQMANDLNIFPQRINYITNKLLRKEIIIKKKGTKDKREINHYLNTINNK